jgi:hypothetical protein
MKSPKRIQAPRISKIGTGISGYIFHFLTLVTMVDVRTVDERVNITCSEEGYDGAKK